MMGYEDMLRALVENSVHARILVQYFALTGILLILFEFVFVAIVVDAN